MKTGHLFLGLAAVLLLEVHPAYANPVEHFGLGSRLSGLGLAGVTAANDFSAVFYNPSGLLLTPGNTYSLGYTFTKPVIEFNGQELDANVIQGYHFGFTNLYGGWFRERLALGFGLYVPTTTLLRALVTAESEPNFYVYNNTEGIFIGLGAGIRPHPSLLVGGGILVAAELKGPVALDIPPITVNVTSLEDIARTLEIQGELKADLDVSVDPVIAPIAGFMTYPFRWMRLGGVFREAIWIPIELALTLRMKTQISGFGELSISELDEALASLPLAVSTNAQYHPRQFGFGMSLIPLRELFLTGDITWKQWSRLKPNYTSLGTPTGEGDVSLDELLDRLTGIFGEGVEVTIPSLPELNLKDTYNFAGGIEWLVLSWLRLRGGYNFRPSPAPEQSGRANFIWPDEHLLTGGLGLILDDPFGAVRRIYIEAHAQTMIMQPIEGKKSEGVPEDNPGFPDYKAGGEFLGMGLTFTGLF